MSNKRIVNFTTCVRNSSIYYDHDYTKYEQSIALMASNLLCLMVVTYYNTPILVTILVYVGIYAITRKALHP